MKCKVGLFIASVALVLAACGGETDKAVEQPEEAGVLEEVEEVEVVEEVKPREQLDVVETDVLFEESLKFVRTYEGAYKLEDERTVAGVHTKTKTELLFQSDFEQPFIANVKGTEVKSVDGVETTTDIHRFTKKDDKQYVLNADGQYEMYDWNYNQFSYKAMHTTPWLNIGAYFGFDDPYNAATIAEQDEDYIYMTTDLTVGLEQFVKTYLGQVYSREEANAVQNFPEFAVTEGTYTLKLDRATMKLLTIEWDFIVEGKNYIDETLALDHYSLYEVIKTADFQIDDMEALTEGAITPAAS